MKSTNILTRTGLDFEVERRPLFSRGIGDGGVETYSKSNLSAGIFRTDTGQQIGNVTPSYEAVQTADVLAPFVRAANEGIIDFKGGGGIDGGKRFCLTFSTGDMTICGEDFQKRIIVGGSHDGSWSTFIKCMVYRVICSNGLLAVDSRETYRCKHTRNHETRYSEVLAAVHNTSEYFGRVMEKMQRFYEVHLDRQRQIELTNKLLDIDTSPGAKKSARKENQKADILRLAQYGRGIKGNSEIQNTGAAWYNAVSEFYGHHVNRQNQEKQFVSAYFGTGEKRIKAAFEMVSAIA